MEQFILGLLVGIALGMWGAILLYRYSGRTQSGPPKQGRAPAAADRPEDDFDEAWYATQERPHTQSAPATPSTQPAQSARPQTAETAQIAQTAPHTAQSAQASVTYTEPPAAPPAQKPPQRLPVAPVQEPASTPNAKPQNDSPPDDPRLDAYAHLLRMLNGDVEATEALIEAERMRTPAVARSRLVENALLRLQYKEE